MSGLLHCKTLNKIQMMGAIVHPLFQNKKRMMESGLCTSSQYNAGEDELLRRLTLVKEFLSGSSDVVILPSGSGKTNKWDDSDDDDDDMFLSPSTKDANDELGKFYKWKKVQLLPTLSSKKTIGAYDVDGQPQEPVFGIGPVRIRGIDLPSGKNHADYIDGNGNYDIVCFLKDHIDKFPALFKVVVGQLAAHITTGVDCESLFSQAGHLSKPRQNRTTCETFERLVISKHRMSRMYCC